jgi:putative oxygen-independent coproporphyrinogen III oxidase
LPGVDLPSRGISVGAGLKPAPTRCDAAQPTAATTAAPLAVYIHWPFCLSKCPYCDFNSHVRHAAIDQQRYVRAFAAEIAATAQRVPGRTVSTIFFGGGTPSLMEPGTVGAILDAVGRSWSVAPDAEVTLEANPTSVEAHRFASYRAAGVNRVSLGVQALDDAALAALGRTHTVREALDAVAIARRLFSRYSFDLIYARPGQTSADWRAELKAAIAEAAEHLSLYQLTVEPDTPFAALHVAGKLKVPDADLARTLYDTTQEVSAAAGLPAYEISNHARPGAECRHNLAYWRYHEYAGIGPGAHGRLDIRGERHATVTEKRPEAWLSRVEERGDGVVGDEVLTRGEAADEFLLMGLRLAEGIALDRFRGIAGFPLADEQIADLAAHGLVEASDGRLRVTAAGFPVLDAIVADLAA